MNIYNTMNIVWIVNYVICIISFNSSMKVFPHFIDEVINIWEINKLAHNHTTGK